jgi:4-hydroxy-tetrahydrodipicolinate synthase
LWKPGKDAEVKGIYNIMVTPFDGNDRIDEESLRNVVDFQIEKGAHGLTILGLLGEGQKLSDDERDFVVKVVMEQVNGRIPVVVTTSHMSPTVVIERSKKAQEMGAEGVMVSPPTLLRNMDAVTQFYATLKNELSLPIVVQDEPVATNVIMPATFLALNGLPIIKLEDPPVPQKITQILSKNPDAQIFGGLGGQYFIEELERGAVGTMTGFAFTEALIEIYDLFNSGKQDEARDLFYKYTPILRYEGQANVSVSIRKEILKRRGAIKNADVRSPGAKLDEPGMEELTKLLEYTEKVTGNPL